MGKEKKDKSQIFSSVKKSIFGISTAIIMASSTLCFTACGTNGKDGKDGKDGTNASMWYHGTVTPTSSNQPGNIGDFYIDQDDNIIYQLTANGWELISNLGTRTEGPQGEPGKDGQDGVTPHIDSATGHWFIGTQDTGYSAIGQDGVTPTITINEDGYWVINGTTTAIKAQGQNGQNGQNGPQGEQGTPGQNGTSILSGILPPLESEGKDGDLYLNTTNYNLYKKQTGVWTLVGNIKGKDADINEEYYTNLINLNAEGIQNGKYMTPSGKIYEASDVMLTDFIQVEIGKSYLYNIPHAGHLGTAYNLVQCFDESGNWISSIKSTTFDDGGTPIEYKDSGTIDYNTLTDDILKLEIYDTKVKFIKLTLGVGTANKVMLVQNDTFPDKYYPYGEPIPINTKVVLTRDEYDLLMSSQNPLYKKSIAFEGDSICAGAGNNSVSYADMVSFNNSMTMTKKAISGGTITDGIYTTDGSLRHSIVQGVLDLVAKKDDYDYIIFEGGVNDTSLDIRSKTEGSDRADNTYVNFGTISTGYDAALDTTTFCGAFETACKALANSGKKTGYIFVHKIFNDNHRWVTEYRPAMIKILNKWGIPYLDLETLTPPLNMVQNLKETYTGNSDGWHPNELGYKSFYVDQITAWLKTL